MITVEGIYLFSKSKTRRDGSLNVTHHVLVPDWEQDFPVRDNQIEGDEPTRGIAGEVDLELVPAQIQREYEGRSYTAHGIEVRATAFRPAAMKSVTPPRAVNS